jgi:hypothetical protein
MKNKVKRTILLFLVAVILFSASMATPIYTSTFKDLMQGAALGLMLAGIISVITVLIKYQKAGKTVK